MRLLVSGQQKSSYVSQEQPKINAKGTTNKLQKSFTSCPAEPMLRPFDATASLTYKEPSLGVSIPVQNLKKLSLCLSRPDHCGSSNNASFSPSSFLQKIYTQSEAPCQGTAGNHEHNKHGPCCHWEKETNEELRCSVVTDMIRKPEGAQGDKSGQQRLP